MNINSTPNRRMDEEDNVGKVTGFFLFRNIINGYNDDKNKEEEERKSIKKYGNIALILSIISLALSLCSIILRMSQYDNIGVPYAVMSILYIVGGIVVATLLGIYAFVFSVMQVRLNRKSIGIISIILSILSVISSLSLIVFLII